MAGDEVADRVARLVAEHGTDEQHTGHHRARTVSSGRHGDALLDGARGDVGLGAVATALLFSLGKSAIGFYVAQIDLAKGQKFMAIGEMLVSPDANMLAYSTDFTGFRQYTLQFKNLLTGSVLPDRIERVTSAAWAADNKTIFYNSTSMSMF